MLMLLFVTGILKLHAQDEDTTVEIVAPPVEAYDEDDDYSASAYEYTPPSLRKVSDSAVARLKREEDFSYANDPSYLQPKKKQVRRDDGSPDAFTRFFKSSTVRVISYILLIAFFLFIIYRIVVVNNLFLFYRSKKITVDDEGGETDMQSDNLDDKINNAINGRDYRSAVRFLYLKGLRLLSDKGWIRYHAQATNHDYVHQLGQKPVAGDFRFLTQVYDYVWYGEFAVNDEQFSKLHSDFNHFYQAVR